MTPKKLLIPRALHPHFKSTLGAYSANLDVDILEIPYDKKTGKMELAFLAEMLKDPQVFAFAASQPNFFGVLEDVDALAELRQRSQALFISYVNNPVSLGLLKPPGEYGADIAASEGQPLGLPLNYGGPGLGLLTAKNIYLRKMPGRICGKTIDVKGKTSYTLTLQAREQHIRREHATSNICTNQSLCALAAAIYLSLLGPQGLKEAAELTFSRAHELWQRLRSLKGQAGRPLFDHEEFFQEFPFETQLTAERLEVTEEARKIIPGYPLIGDFPELPNTILMAATEKTTSAMIENLAGFLIEPNVTVKK